MRRVNLGVAQYFWRGRPTAATESTRDPAPRLRKLCQGMLDTIITIAGASLTPISIIDTILNGGGEKISFKSEITKRRAGVSLGARFKKKASVPTNRSERSPGANAPPPLGPSSYYYIDTNQVFTW